MPDSLPPKAKLNLGCGSNKIPGYINIDSEESVEPDLLLSLPQGLATVKDESISEILCFHMIEHLPKHLHNEFLSHCNRILEPDGVLYITAPDFERCAMNFIANFQGKRDFWEATIFGRGLYAGDMHRSAVTPKELSFSLMTLGFSVRQIQEPESHNFALEAKKRSKITSYEKHMEQIYGTTGSN